MSDKIPTTAGELSDNQPWTETQLAKLNLTRPCGKVSLHNAEEYRAALSTLREYFSRPLDSMDSGPDGAFDAKGWRAMTYLLQAAVRYEIDILGMKIDWAKGN